jgi:MFS family permease
MYIIWLIPCAAAQNIQTMLVARFLGGLSGSSFLSVAGGSVGDVFSNDQLQTPMIFYTATPFAGPVLGPLVGGFINQFTSWLVNTSTSHHVIQTMTKVLLNRRWSFYILIIWSTVLLLGTVFLVPETYHPVIIRTKAQRLRKETNCLYYAPMERTDRTVAATILRSMTRPFQLLILDPMCLCLCLYTAIIIGIVYMFFGAIPLIFAHNHDFELYQVGLSFLGMLIGTGLGAATDPLWSRNYIRLAAQHVARGGDPDKIPPETRLPPAIVGAFLVSTGLFWFAWTTYRSIHWIVPILGSMVFSVGSVLIYELKKSQTNSIVLQSLFLFFWGYDLPSSCVSCLCS